MPFSRMLKLPMTDFWIDAHSHLADARWGGWGPESSLERVMAKAEKADVVVHLQGGVGPEDWQRQRELHRSYPGILPVFGIHPYFVADRSESECEEALDLLAKNLSGAYALGETGLDFRPHIARGSEARQIAMMEAQLELASAARLPVVLHVVRAFDEALRVVDLFYPKGQRRGLIHAFNGTEAQANAWVERGFMISIGGALLRPDNERLRQAVAAIPLNCLLIESDSPDQRPSGWVKEWNEPDSVKWVAQEIANIQGLTVDVVRARTVENLFRLLDVQVSFLV